LHFRDLLKKNLNRKSKKKKKKKKLPHMSAHPSIASSALLPPLASPSRGRFVPALASAPGSGPAALEDGGWPPDPRAMSAASTIPAAYPTTPCILNRARSASATPPVLSRSPSRATSSSRAASMRCRWAAALGGYIYIYYIILLLRVSILSC
jgi:hypothetical protein